MHFKMIQNVKTRWNSICIMLLRAKRLKFSIEDYIRLYQKTQSALTHLKLISKQWIRISYLIQLLKSFAVCDVILNSNKEVTINQVWLTYDQLFSHMKDHKFTLERKRRSWKRELLFALNNASSKLSSYYEDVKNQKKLIYNLSTILNLYDKLTLYDRVIWKEDDIDYKTKYRKAFVSYYCKNYEKLSNDETVEASRESSKKIISLTQLSRQQSDVSSKVQSQVNETNRYLNERKLK